MPKLIPSLFFAPRESLPRDELASVVAGGGAGVCSALVTTPFDVIKTRLQVNRSMGAASRPSWVIQTVWRSEGVAGFYRGLSPLLGALIPTWGVYFPTYNASKFALGDRAPSPVVHMVSAVIAGSVTAVVTNPLWVVKTRLQTQTMANSSHRYSGVVNAFVRIAREEGMGGFYKGLSASLIGTSHVAIQFPLYEFLKGLLHADRVDHTVSPIAVMAAAALSKVVASCATYPHEVVRSRLQNQVLLDGQHYTGLLDAGQRILKEEGVYGFYRGLGVNLIKVVPAGMITFVSYEVILRRMSEFDE